MTLIGPDLPAWGREGRIHFPKNAQVSKKCPILKKNPIFTGPDLKRARCTGLSAQRARRTKLRGQKGLHLVGAQRALKLLVTDLVSAYNYFYICFRIIIVCMQLVMTSWCSQQASTLSLTDTMLAIMWLRPGTLLCHSVNRVQITSENCVSVCCVDIAWKYFQVTKDSWWWRKMSLWLEISACTNMQI